MPLIVDAYNVLHVTGILPPDLAGLDLAGLARLIERSSVGRQRVTLVCDGLPPVPQDSAAGSRPGSGVRPLESADDPPHDVLTILDDSPIEVRYAGRQRSADDLMAELIQQDSAPRRLTVVSSDREILATAKARKCPTMTSEQFLERLALDASRARRDPRSDAKPTTGKLPDELMDEAQRLLDDPDIS